MVNDGEGYAKASYKKEYGVVHIKGLVKSGTIGSPIFNLPVGYRPKEAVSKTIITNNGTNSMISWLIISNNGNVMIQPAISAGNAYAYLDCSFPAE